MLQHHAGGRLPHRRSTPPRRHHRQSFSPSKSLLQPPGTLLHDTTRAPCTTITTDSCGVKPTESGDPRDKPEAVRDPSRQRTWSRNELDRHAGEESWTSGGDNKGKRSGGARTASAWWRERVFMLAGCGLGRGDTQHSSKDNSQHALTGSEEPLLRGVVVPWSLGGFDVCCECRGLRCEGIQKGARKSVSVEKGIDGRALSEERSGRASDGEGLQKIFHGVIMWPGPTGALPVNRAPAFQLSLQPELEWCASDVHGTRWC